MPDAYDDGLTLLARRALTRREVAERLAARGHDTQAVDDALSRLTARGALDDAALARRWIGDAAAARGRGRSRALATLEARGVDPAVASSAWAEAVDDGAIDGASLLARAVRRRLGAPGGTVDRGRLARVYNALLSEGFEPTELESALAPYGFEGIP